MKIWTATFAAAIALCGFTTGAVAQKLEPGKTVAAVLPVVNKSGELSQQFNTRNRDAANAALEKQFSIRGFKVLGTNQCGKVAADLGIRFEERESWKAEPIIQVARKLNADIIALAIVLDSHSSVNNGGIAGYIGGSQDGRAHVRVLLFKTATGESLVASEAKGESSSGFLAYLDKGMDRQTTATMVAIGNGLNTFLMDYPITAKAPKKKVDEAAQP